MDLSNVSYARKIVSEINLRCKIYAMNQKKLYIQGTYSHKKKNKPFKQVNICIFHNTKNENKKYFAHVFFVLAIET